jgi:fructokinase
VRGQKVDVVDTTGAGDGFVAGLLTEMLPALRAGERPGTLTRAAVEAACGLANRVAARVVTRFGATAALPHRDSL